MRRPYAPVCQQLRQRNPSHANYTNVVPVVRLRLHQGAVTESLYSQGCVCATHVRMVHDMSTTQPSLILRLENIQALREVRGLESDSDLAAAMKVNQSTVSRTMRGVAQPGPRFIAGLSFALETPLNHLFAVDGGAAA